MSRQAAGFKAWLLQRITAVYLGLYILYLAFHFALDAPQSYGQWRDWVADPIVNVSLGLFFASMLLHAWIGVRDIFIDYIHPIVPRLVLLSLLGLGLIGCGIWAAKILITAGIS